MKVLSLHDNWQDSVVNMIFNAREQLAILMSSELSQVVADLIGRFSIKHYKIGVVFVLWKFLFL